MFKIGDIVQLKKGHSARWGFQGRAIFQGQSNDGESCVALELLDHKRSGGAQNGWWNFATRDLDSLELVETPVEQFRRKEKALTRFL